MIETERLWLERLSRAHVGPWRTFMLDGSARAGLHTPNPAESAEHAAAALDRFVEVAEMYALVVRDGGDVAGFSGFVPRQLEWGGELELGWMLLPVHRGRGYATEAARMLLATRPGQRIVSLIRTDNPASEAVATRIGATRERVFEYHGYQTGVWVSSA